MKNNKIMLSQFWFLAFLSSLVSLLFLGNKPTVIQLITFAAAELAVLFLTSFWRGKPSKLLRAICSVYLGIFCVACACRFTDYMKKALGYEQYVLIAVVLLTFCFFCTVKGIEAFARAAVIIGVFLIASAVYIFVCAAPKLRFSFESGTSLNILPVLTVFYPTVLYVMLSEDVIREKTPTRFILPIFTLAVVSGFMLIAQRGSGDYPIQFIPEHSNINVFKGADCLLLGLLTSSVLYIIAASILAVFGNSRHNYLTNSISCAVILVLSVICMSISQVSDVFFSEIFACAVSAATIPAVIVSALINKRRNDV